MKQFLFIRTFGLTFSLMFILSTTPLFTQNYSWSFNPSLLIGSFWVRNYEMKEFQFLPPFSPQEITEMIQTQAIEAFSGMIYGYTFELIPNSLLNNVSRSFSYEPKGTIDPTRVVLELQEKDKEKSEFLCKYKTNEFERRKRRFWEESQFLPTKGQGTASLFDGMEARKKAVEKAIQRALLNLFQTHLVEKPRAIEGAFVLVNPPRIFLDHGKLIAEVELRVQEIDIENYYN